MLARFLANLLNLRATLENPSTPLSSDEAWLYTALGARSTKAGVTVTPEGSMQLAAVYACVRIIAETIASLPLPVYKRLPNGGKERTPSHPLYRILHDRPNPDMSSFTFFETSMAHLLLWGNAYAEVERSTAGLPIHLWPIHPARVRVERRNSRKTFLVLVDGQWVPFTDQEILHVPGLGYDGMTGFSPIDMERQSLGVAIAAEDYAGRFFANDARPSVVLSHPNVLDNDVAKRIRTSFKEAYGGVNQQGVALLEEGMTLTTVTIPPEHAQFLETRKYQTSEVARIFRVPPHLIGDVERSTSWGTGIEQQDIGFVKHTLRPWLVRWERTLNWELFGDRSAHFTEFLIDGIVRGDIKSRYEAYAIGKNNGWLSADDIREFENQNPLPDGQGKMYMVPRNMAPADKIVELLDAEMAPPPAPPASEAESEADPGERGILPLPRRADSDVLTRQVLAARALVEDAVRRMVRREARDAVRVAGKVPALGAWAGPYYERHEAVLAEALLPAVRMHLALIGSTEPPEARAAAIAAAHVRASLAAFEALVAGDDAPAAVRALVARWETDRPRAVADSLMREELSYVVAAA